MDWREAEREYEDEVVGTTTLARLFEDAAARHEHRPAQMFKGGVYRRSLADTVVSAAPAGEYRTLTYGDVRGVVRNLAAGFRDLGVGADDRVAIFAGTRMEWAQCDFALLAAGVVVTTVYPGSSESQTRYLLSDADATGVVAENRELVERVLAVEDDLDADLEFVVSMDRLERADGSRPAYADREDVYELAAVHDAGARVFDPEEYEGWIDDRDVDDLASLIYTSGTTGQPKGVKLTHRNFRANVNQVRKRYAPRPDRDEDAPALDETSRSVSYLPLAHVFERLAGHFIMFGSGVCVAYAESPETLREDFQLVEPTTATSVPRVYEKIYDAIREQAQGSPVRERIFEWATDVGRAYDAAEDPGLGLRAKMALADRLVFDKVKSALGGSLELLFSGGGSLSPELCALYHGMGLPIYEGYGLTETAPVVSVNPPEAPRIGTIGPPVDGVDVRIDESVVEPGQFEDDGDVGELVVRGPNVSDGYWNKPEETAAAFEETVPAGDGGRDATDGGPGTAGGEDGAADSGAGTDDGREATDGGSAATSGAGGKWFRTGDVVHRRPDGYLAFRERVKQILVLSTGKNVAPGSIEDGFAASDVVEQCMVVGDGEKFVGALLVPNLDRLRAAARDDDVDLPDDPAAVCDHDWAVDRVGAVVDAVNRDFEAHERIKGFRLVPEEFTEENDLLTPTMKKKRRNIEQRYAAEVDAIYAEDGAAGNGAATDDAAGDGPPGSPE